MRHMDMMVDADVGHDVHFLLDADFDGTAESISSRRRVRRGRAGRVQCLVEYVTIRSATYQSVGQRAPFGEPEPEVAYVVDRSPAFGMRSGVRTQTVHMRGVRRVRPLGACYN